MTPRLVVLVLFSITLYACAPAPNEDAGPALNGELAPRPAVDPALAPGEHVWTAADGVKIPYEVHGEGDPTVVLIHCWMCDRTFWSGQIPVLQERYRTLALDLPGHGEAGRDRDHWTIEAYGEDVAGLIRELDLGQVVLVGHSMGGPVSLRAAALAGDRVRGIVAVDTLHDAEFEFSGEQTQQFIAAFEADYAKTCGDFIESMFPEEGVEEIKMRVSRQSCDPGREEIGIALIKDFGQLDVPALFSGMDVPIRAINAAGPNPTKTETNRKYADFDAVILEEVGHYPHMTRPEVFNPLLLEAVNEVLEESS